MNRKLLALAIGAALTLPMTAQAAPTLYGMLNLSVDRVDLESQGTATASLEETQLNSNSSRLGVKGEESLGNGMSAVYKAEWAVSGDVAGTTDLTGRDRYLGLKSDSMGTVKLGAYDSPLKSSQGTVDLFNDMTYTDMGNFLTGENRLNNVIGYESPKIADVLTVNVAVQSGEGTSAGNDDDDGQSVSVVFQSGGLYLAAAMDNDITDSTAFDAAVDFATAAAITLPSAEAASRDTIRVTGIYTADALQLGAMLQTSEFSNDEAGFDMDEQAVLLSASYSMGKSTIKGQYVMNNLDFGGGAEVDVTAIELGYDHNCTQMTKLFAQVSMANTDPGTGTDTDDTVLSVGMQTKF